MRPTQLLALQKLSPPNRESITTSRVEVYIAAYLTADWLIPETLTHLQ